MAMKVRNQYFNLTVKAQCIYVSALFIFSIPPEITKIAWNATFKGQMSQVRDIGRRRQTSHSITDKIAFFVLPPYRF